MKFRKKREMTIQWRPIEDTKPPTTPPEDDEKKTNFAAKAVRMGQKTIIVMAVVVYGYVLVDTFRQVKVAEANNSN